LQPSLFCFSILLLREVPQPEILGENTGTIQVLPVSVSGPIGTMIHGTHKSQTTNHNNKRGREKGMVF
jgi:hypothetical protein